MLKWILTAALAVFALGELRAQDGACAQGGGSSSVSTCGTCSAQTIPAGVTLVESCSEDCRSTGDCPDCCWVCEAYAYGGGTSYLQVAEIGSNPYNSDDDLDSPFIVEIEVTSSCKRGSEGSTKCVQFFVIATAGAGRVCYRLTCDPCVDIESE